MIPMHREITFFPRANAIGASVIAAGYFKTAASIDLSDEKLQDMVGINPQKLAARRDTVLGVAKRVQFQGRHGLR
jgi:hypothetical protein